MFECVIQVKLEVKLQGSFQSAFLVLKSEALCRSSVLTFAPRSARRNGTFVGEPDQVGNFASTSEPTPIYTVFVRGVSENAFLFPDVDNPARLVSANVGKAIDISPADDKEEKDGYTYVNEPFKYTPGKDHRAGRESWLNKFIIVGRDDKDTVYWLSIAKEPREEDDDDDDDAEDADVDDDADADADDDDEDDDSLKAFPELPLPNPAVLEEALNSGDFDAVSDTGASAGVIMTRV